MNQTPSKIADILVEHNTLEQQLADPELHNDPVEAKRVSKRFAQLSPIVDIYHNLQNTQADLATAQELAKEDKSFEGEVESLTQAVEKLESSLSDALLPRDPHDADNVILEVKAGAGGEESALFAADIARMYTKYAESQKWQVAILDTASSDLGGYKEVTMSIRSKGTGLEGVWAKLKFEGGVHRVQRVPVTESQGRVHTSAIGVMVFPETEEAAEVVIDEKDLRIDVYRSSGKGGQGVNTTDSAVRITHLPTGIVVTCQNERSQLQNKTRAMHVLAARLQALQEEQAEKEAAADRAKQIRTVDRSERIRTYNFPENRITDHRIGYKANNLDAVLNGELESLVEALISADREARLQAE